MSDAHGTYDTTGVATTTGTTINVDNSLINTIPTTTLGGISNSGTTVTSIDSSSWGYADTMKFNIDGERLEFSGKELIRLKEMLQKFILEEHPEDLL